MDYGDIFSDIRRDIFRVLHDSEELLRFNDLKNKTGLRSNELAYHVKVLLDTGLIMRLQEGDNVMYSLSKGGKAIYPYLPIMLDEQRPVFVVACAALIDGDHIYFQKKPREPEKGSLIFFGGKVLSGKSIESSLREYITEQAGCDIEDLRLRCVNEFMKDDDYRFHNIVYFHTARPIGDMRDGLVKKRLSRLDHDELFWDNRFFIEKNLDNEYPKVTKTVF